MLVYLFIMQIEYQNYNNHWMPDQLFNKNKMKICSRYFKVDTKLTLLKITHNTYCFTQKYNFYQKIVTRHINIYRSAQLIGKITFKYF